MENCLALGFWAPPSIITNKFFDPSTPFMRKVDNGEKNKKKKNCVILTSMIVDRPNADQLKCRLLISKSINMILYLYRSTQLEGKIPKNILPRLKAFEFRKTNYGNQTLRAFLGCKYQTKT